MTNDNSQLDNFFMPSQGVKKKPRRPAKLGPRAKKFKLWLKSKLAVFLPSREQFWHLPKVLSVRERYLILALAAAAAGALVAIPVAGYYRFTTVQPDYGGSFNEGLVGTPKYINPLLAQTSDVDRDLSELIYAGLLKFDDRGGLTDDLAKFHEVSADGLIYTFKLRDGLKWHDGQPLTADDIVFTVLAVQNADYGSFQRINWQGVEVNKIDEQTVTFKLKNKYAQFLNNATLGILPKHLWESVKPVSFGLSELNLKPIGSGPYQFSKIRRDSAGNIQSYELAAADGYYQGKPYISKIIFRFYESEDKLIDAFNRSEIDGLSFISPPKLNSVRWLGKLQIKELKLPRYFAVFFNQNQSQQLSDKNVRLALNYATDKNTILDKLLANKGTAVDSPMLSGIIDLPPPQTKYDYNPEKAKKILDEAGWKLPAAGPVREKAPPPPKKGGKSPVPESTKLEIKLTTSNWPELVMAAGQLKEQWEKIGAKVNVEILALPELQPAIKDRGYESLLFGEVLGLDPDPFSFWHSSQKRDPGLNLALYDNKNADKLLEDARQTLDDSIRLSKYADFQQLVINDAPVVFLYSPSYLYGQAKKIQANGAAVIAIPSDRFNAINKWYIETRRSFGE
ncbi:MAG: ABC transporter substrate-binding protein [Patescibacteria group bacterium]